jgi:hypothetical protein
MVFDGPNERHDGVPGRSELLGDMASEKSGTAGDEDLHVSP